jgi:hypothetical protein
MSTLAKCYCRRLANMILLTAGLTPLWARAEAPASAPAAAFNEKSITLLAVGRRAGANIDWWTPSGDATKASDAAEKKVTTDGTYALFRIAPTDMTLEAYCLRGSGMLKFKTFERLAGTDQWLGLIDFPAERRYANMMMQVSAPSKYWVTIRNVALRPGLHAVSTTVLENLETDRQFFRDESKRRLADAKGKPFVYTLDNGAVIQLIGAARLTDKGMQFWAPDGSPATNPGVSEADLETGGTSVLYRALGERVSWQACNLSDPQRKPSYRGGHIRPAFLMVEPLDSPPGDQFDDFALIHVTGQEYEERARAALTAADAGKEKEINKNGIASIEILATHEPKSFEADVIYTPENPAYGQYFALDKSGVLHESTTLSGSGQKSRYRFDLPLADLSAIVCRRAVTGWIRFKGLALNPGKKTKVQIETGMGEAEFPDTPSATPKEKPRPEWVNLRHARQSAGQAVLDLGTNKNLPLPDDEKDEALAKHFANLGKGDLAYDGQLICLRGATAGEWKLGKIESWKPTVTVGDLNRYDLPKPPLWFLVTLANGDLYEITLVGSSGQAGINFQQRKANWFKQGEPIEGVVLGPDDKPVAGALVAFASSSPTLCVTNGSIDRNNRGPVVETDEKGRYSFPPHPFPFALVALDDRGFALKSDKEVAQDSTLNLAEWARVEGAVRIGPKPASGKDIEVRFNDVFQPDKGIYMLMDCHGKTNAAGKYFIPNVPPRTGQIAISEIMRKTKDGMMHMGAQHCQWIDPPAGKTLTLNLGGTGRAVVGRFAPPPGRQVTDWSVNMNSFTLKQPEPPYPSGMLIEERPPWLEIWHKTPEGHAHMLAGRSYTLRVDDDGTFRLDDIMPGTYELRFYLSEGRPDGRDGTGEAIGNLQRDVIVPDAPGGPADAPLDVGTLELNGPTAPVTAQPRTK